ncbi:MAG: hypothetical protein M3O82_01525, partial [Verrucomicrobiota bacterium]|nr:hypothetical protein [Verrucomicrobiota bacterium]
ALTGVDSTDVVLRQTLKQLKIGATYTLSFKVKGAEAKKGSWTLFMHADDELAPDKITRGERGSVTRRTEMAVENIKEGGNISPNATWSTISKTFTVKFTNKDVNKSEMTKLVVLDVRFAPVPHSGVVYLDDFQLVEKGAQ